MCMNCKSGCWKIGVLVVVGIAALAWVVMALWNWLVPSLFVGMHEIGYMQALGLLVLSKILFGSLHGHCGWHGRCHHHHCNKMTAEEGGECKSGSCGCCVSGEDEKKEAPKG